MNVVAGASVLGVGAAMPRLASGCDASGGLSPYVRRSSGPFAGFQVGWLFSLARIIAMANPPGPAHHNSSCRRALSPGAHRGDGDVAGTALLSGLERREVLFGMIGIGIGLMLQLVARRECRDRAPDREAV